MNLDFRYLGKSGVGESKGGTSVHFSPNLAREKVFFDSELLYPLRFREAMSALHDVVVGDLKFRPKNKAAYEAYLAAKKSEEATLRRSLTDAATQAALAKIAKEKPPPNLDKDFRKMHRLYWNARVQWANELARFDPELFRHLVPCDPVVTVAPDCVFFECFSKDESAYGCLLLDRNAHLDNTAGLGTTNVDYSLALYDHFQTLRTYRPTRLLVDPSGFEVAVSGNEDVREEKIDLPSSWLRGFLQLQATMTLPARRIELPVDVVYSILAHLSRNREKTGPRSLRFQLTPGRPPVIVLDPWGIALQSHGPSVDDGAFAPGFAPSGGQGPYRSAPNVQAARPTEEVKVWGRRRLFALARLLPLADKVEVRLYGSGMPSVWVLHLGEMRFVLALSGWTANDWTSGGNLELLRNVVPADVGTTSRVARYLETERLASVGQMATMANVSSASVLTSLFQLSTEGQVVYDFAADKFRYRPVLSVALSEAVLGPESPELSAGRRIVAAKQVRIEREEALDGGKRLFVFKAQETSCEVVVDADLSFTRAKCTCSYFYKNGLRAGPCRHLIALRFGVLTSANAAAEVPPNKAEAAVGASPSSAVLRGGPKREEEFSLLPDVAKEMRAVASRSDKGLSEVFEAAWDLVFEQLLSQASWKNALALAPSSRTTGIEHKTVQNPEKNALFLHVEILKEVEGVAKAFGASPSALVNLAWIISRRKP